MLLQGHGPFSSNQNDMGFMGGEGGGEKGKAEHTRGGARGTRRTCQGHLG